MTYPQQDDLAYLHGLASVDPNDRATAAKNCGRDFRFALAELPAVVDCYEREDDWPGMPLLQALSRITGLIQMTDGDIGPLADEALQRALAYLRPSQSHDIDSPSWWERVTAIKAMGRVTEANRARMYAGHIVRRLHLEADTTVLCAYCCAISAIVDRHTDTLDTLQRTLSTLQRHTRSLTPQLKAVAQHAQARLAAAVDRRLAEAMERIKASADEDAQANREYRRRTGGILFSF